MITKKVNLELYDPFDSIILKEDFEVIFDNLDKCKNLINGSKFLITGSSGMIASYFVLFIIYLIEKKKKHYKIFLMTTNTLKLKKKLGKYFSRDYIEIIDFNIDSLMNFEYEFDYILHAASLASPHYYNTNPVDVIAPNIIGTYNLLMNLVKNKIQVKCFLFLSSFSVYGNVTDTVIDETYPTNLNHFDLRHIYGASKISGELLLHTFNTQYKIPIKIARLAHSFGPGLDYEKDSRIFSNLVSNILENKPFNIHSSTSSRTYTYLSDLTTGLMLIMLKQSKNIVFNLSNSSNNISNLELVYKLSSFYGNEVKIIVDSSSEYVKSEVIAFPDFRKENVSDIGWKPNVSVFEAFSRTVNFIKENELL